MIRADYITHSGDDLLVVNAARVSFAKRSEIMTAGDRRLIAYLAKHGHWTPFAHPQITIHCRAPLFVRTQCFKHKVGFVENEVSRRYVDDAPEYFMPERWRGRAEDKKQGSSDTIIHLVDLGDGDASSPDLLLEDLHRTATETYAALIDGGVAPEQARMCLPQSMLTEWFWTGSLSAWARFCALRLKPDAQYETALLAGQCDDIVQRLFPVSWPALAGWPQSEEVAA